MGPETCVSAERVKPSGRRGDATKMLPPSSQRETGQLDPWSRKGAAWVGRSLWLLLLFGGRSPPPSLFLTCSALRRGAPSQAHPGDTEPRVSPPVSWVCLPPSGHSPGSVPPSPRHLALSAPTFPEPRFPPAVLLGAGPQAPQPCTPSTSLDSFLSRLFWSQKMVVVSPETDCWPPL